MLGDMVPIATENHRMVELFNLNRRVDVVDVSCLVEYTTHLHKIGRTDRNVNAVIDACEKAHAYIANSGLPRQLDLLRIINWSIPKKKVTMPEFGVGYPVGLVVWAHQDRLPWWPAVVVNRKQREQHLVMEPGETVPREADTNRMVEFFHLNQRVAVLQVKRLVEYATHMKKISSAGVHINDIINACYEARAYITDKGLPGQQDLVQAPNFNLPKNLAVMPAFGVGFAVGLVVWARLVGFPWWPAVVVDRKEHPEMETGGTLPIAAESSRMVELFKDTHTARLRGGS